MAKKKLFIVDVETTGLNPEAGHVMVSIGAIAEVRPTKKAPEQFVEFYGIVAPTELEWAKASQDALKVNGMTLEFLQQNGSPLSDVRDEFLAWLMLHKVSQTSHVWLGQNPKFDIRFMMYQMGQELKFVNAPVNDPIDIRDLYGILANRQKVPILKYQSGHNISKALGVQEEDVVHNALEGARVVKRNYDAMVALGLFD